MINLSDIFSGPKKGIILICVLIIAAIIEFLSLGLARRTFVFYTISNDKEIVVEDRMIKHASSKEENIIRYVEEVLLGPVSPELLPLFPRESRLKSLIFTKDGIVYADFTEDAALPPLEGGHTKDNFQTLHDGILRNFSFVKDIRFFIEGHSIFREEMGELEERG